MAEAETDPLDELRRRDRRDRRPAARPDHAARARSRVSASAPSSRTPARRPTAGLQCAPGREARDRCAAWSRATGRPLPKAGARAALARDDRRRAAACRGPSPSPSSRRSGRGYWDLARDHFGSLTPDRRPMHSAQQVLRARDRRRRPASACCRCPTGRSASPGGAMLLGPRSQACPGSSPGCLSGRGDTAAASAVEALAVGRASAGGDRQRPQPHRGRDAGGDVAAARCWRDARGGRARADCRSRAGALPSQAAVWLHLVEVEGFVPLRDDARSRRWPGGCGERGCASIWRSAATPCPSAAAELGRAAQGLGCRSSWPARRARASSRSRPMSAARPALPGVARPIQALLQREARSGRAPRRSRPIATLAGDLHRYPDGGAERAARRRSAAASASMPTRIVCGAGSDELIAC